MQGLLHPAVHRDAGVRAMRRDTLKLLKIFALAASAALISIGAAEAYTAHGKASFYGGGGRTASGGRVGHMTAAHRTLPFGAKVRVTNLNNQRSVVVTVNDRGPFIRGRIIDVSTGAAQALGFRAQGVAPVRIEVVSN
jgi:rare lipoprotein A